jgi:hypothetical protein
LAAVLNRTRGLVSGQPLSDAATNQAERNALDTATDHIRQIWSSAVHSAPSEPDLIAVLKLMHVVVLDVEEGGAAEGQALDLLGIAIICVPGQASSAWSYILQTVADLSQRRSAIDPAALRARLQTAIPLKVTPSYGADVEKLKQHSRATLDYLSIHSRIIQGGASIRATRAVVSALRTASEETSVLVVGVPGAGKSGVLHDYARSLLDEGRDLICIATDRVAARTLGELRNELGLEHEVLDVLRNWPGSSNGLLVVDALDASRGDPAGAALFTLIEAVAQRGDRWCVVASIRKYDLRYSPVLRNLFRSSGAPEINAEFQDREFNLERHVNVPLFSDAELAEIRGQASTLDQLLNIAPVSLLDLLRVPFNLRLMADILESGVDLADLRPIRTQGELLRRFWQYRLLAASDASLRERIVQQTCRLMVDERRLRVERQRIVEPGSASALEALLSGNVLIEWQSAATATPSRQIISFSHHILFDFSVSQLLLPPDFARVVELLSGDPDLFLVIRPSIVMRFEQLWREDRDEFWNLVFAFAKGPGIPPIGKLIGATVLTEVVQQLEDLGPLMERLQSDDLLTRGAAETVFQHLVGALTAGDPAKLSGASAGPWCDMLAELTKI